MTATIGAIIILSMIVVLLIFTLIALINKMAEHDIRISELEDIINETYRKTLLNPKEPE